MTETNLYLFIAKVALEFRLSLDNICKILKKEPTDEMKTHIYQKIMNLDEIKYGKKEAYQYLFTYETQNESLTVSVISFSKAINFIKRYNSAVENNDTDKLKELMIELNKTENDFNKVIPKLGRQELTDEDIEIISRYRIKNALSKYRFCQKYNISRSGFQVREKNIKNSFLKKKLDILSDFYISVENKKLVSKTK